jgi:uncharacterized DUF497 family protein
MYNDEGDGFDWDDANLGHIARHGVSRDEAEQVVLNDPVDGGQQMQDGEERFLQIGVTDTLRVLVVVTTWRGDLVRVVTAYPAPPNLRAYFAAERSGGNG